jgi:hypothetical protein
MKSIVSVVNALENMTVTKEQGGERKTAESRARIGNALEFSRQWVPKKLI